LVDASVLPVGEDMTGELSSAHIILCGPLSHAELVAEVQSSRFVLQKGETKVQFEPDCIEDCENGTLALGRQLACLRLRRQHNWGVDFCLVLKRERGDDYPTYSRVGWTCDSVTKLGVPC
jgi:hypothetical protein